MTVQATVEAGRVVHVGDVVEVALASGALVRCSDIFGPDNTIETRTLRLDQTVEVVTGRDGHVFIRTLSEDQPRTAQALEKVCVNCRASFVFGPSERRFYAERGLFEPRRCPACRASRRAAGQTQERV